MHDQESRVARVDLVVLVVQPAGWQLHGAQADDEGTVVASGRCESGYDRVTLIGALLEHFRVLDGAVQGVGASALQQLNPLVAACQTEHPVSR